VAATSVVWIGMSSRDCGHDLKSYHTPLRIQPATAALHILITNVFINSLIPPRNFTDTYPPSTNFYPHSHTKDDRLTSISHSIRPQRAANP
jgi:hypothetical protein